MKPPKSKMAELAHNATGGEKSHAETDKSAEFKMTELGPIPVDWEVKRLGEIGEPLMCKRILKSQTFDVGDVPFYKIGTFGGIADAYISRDLYESFRRKYPYPKKGDVLLSAAGTIGRTVVYDGKDAYFQDSNIVWVDNDEKRVLNDYLYWWYKVILWNTEDGGIVTRLYNSNLKASLIAVPPLAEQRRIAGVLSDVDELISALGKLIEKKRNIKTGAMQELLTGKTRLPGFGNPETQSLCASVLKKDTEFEDLDFNTETQRHEVTEFKMTELGPIPKDWEVKRLGEVSSLITKGTTPTSVGCDFECYGINFIKAESISDTGDFIPEKFAHIDEHTDMLLSRSKLKKGDFLFSIAGVLGRVALVTDEVLPANTNQALAVIRLGSNNIIDKRYLFFALKSEYLRSRVKEENVAAAQANLSLQDVNDFHVAVPPLAEQQAIAAVLSDMDAEIAALEADRAKYESIKQGMMQELLTGKTRLLQVR